MRCLIRSTAGLSLILLAALTPLEGLAAHPNTALSEPPSDRRDFVLAAPQGFGDRQNTWAWSMTWWNGRLYVGTNRAWHCVEYASFNHLLPWAFPYPPHDPDVECTRKPEALPLQAEIWRWTPPDLWERVYQSPEDIPIPGSPGKFVARDIGFRGLSVFKEPDGTEALYAAGVNAQLVGYDVPPPRILRSTDGSHFAPVPQDPGTTLGDVPFGSFRNQVSYNGKFYIVGGLTQGSGVLLEAANPAGGNNNFRVVSPPGMVASAVGSYNGYLYVGIRNAAEGYAVLKTDATGEPPYTYTPVVIRGGYLPDEPNSEILSMKVFNNRLYLGGNGLKAGSNGSGNAAELIRINPDDSWDVVVGYPRLTPDGWKFPISGLPAGFGNTFNAHMWRMEVYNGNLYVGTFDSSTTFKDDPFVEPLVRHVMGFDLYRTPNGTSFYPVTTRGFGDKFNFGVRSLQATPWGLFLGTANYYYGLQIWRAPAEPENKPHLLYLPLVTHSSAASSSALFPALAVNSNAAPPPGLQLPIQVETEVVGDAVVVSWEPVAGADHYRIVRCGMETVTLPTGLSTKSLFDEVTLPEHSEEKVEALRSSVDLTATIWTLPVEIGTTSDFYFVDKTAEAGKRYIYSVEALAGAGQSSVEASNIALAPSLMPLATFDRLTTSLTEMKHRGDLSPESEQEVTRALATAQALLATSDFVGAAQVLADLRARLERHEQTLVTSWKAEDLSRLLGQLERRVQLVQAGILRPLDLNGSVDQK